MEGAFGGLERGVGMGLGAGVAVAVWVDGGGIEGRALRFCGSGLGSGSGSGSGVLLNGEEGSDAGGHGGGGSLVREWEVCLTWVVRVFV